MVTCRGCGDELAEEASFCPKCGLRTEKGEREGARTPVGAPRPDWEKDVEAALNNATRLMEDAFQAARKGLQAAADEIGVELERARRRTKALEPVYCPKCGNKNPGDAQYCTVCGEEIPR
jgi:ribosomal protein L40E